MKVTSVTTEKVLDTNPNIYLERAERYLRNKQFDEALEEASLAVKYSNSNQRVREQYNKIKSAVDEHYARLDPGKFIRAAEQYFHNGRYDKAIDEAKIAVKYSNNDIKYINELDRIKSMVEAKQNELRKLEREADSHMEAARKLINSGRYDEALKEARAGKACVNSNKYLNEFNSIEAIVWQKKAEAKADKAMEQAKYMLGIGEYDKALIEARAAINHSSNSKYMNEFNKIKTIVEDRKAEIQADSAIEKAKLLINNGEYYKGLEEANRALSLSNNHNCHAKYVKEFINIESSLKQLPKEQLHIIADEYKRNNLLYKAKEWYENANDVRAYYEIGKIDFYKFNNKGSGISYLEKAADMKYVPALIELINIYAKGTSLNKDLHIARKYYKTLKKVDKQAAKQVSGVIKEAYKSLLAEKLNIKKWLKKVITKKRAIIMSTIIMLISLIYVGTMFATGKWKGIINKASIEVQSNIIGLGEAEAYNVKLNMIPFFAKEPIKEVVAEDSSIAKVEDGKIQGINEGKTNIILYLHGKEVNRVPITISKMGVKDFKIHYDGELKLLGDSITPNIEIIYFNDTKKGAVNTTFSSSNENVIRVNKNQLVAVGEGKATVTVKVNDLEKKLIFNISKKKQEANTNNQKQEADINNNKQNTNIQYAPFSGQDGTYIEYPTFLTEYRGNMQERKISNKSGTIEMFLVNYSNKSEKAENRYNEMLRKINNVSYKFCGSDRYVISWKEGGKINYFCEIVKSYGMSNFLFKYPADKEEEFKPIVDRMYSSFKFRKEILNFDKDGNISGSSWVEE